MITADQLPKDLREVSEDTMRRIAKIVGFASSAAAAIKDFEERRAAGQNPVFFISASTQMIFVGDDLGNAN